VLGSTTIGATTSGDGTFLGIIDRAGITEIREYAPDEPAEGPFVGFTTVSFGNAVPESSTWAMMLLGFAGLGFAGYRRARGGQAPSQPDSATSRTT
jgi:hypothetical protein